MKEKPQGDISCRLISFEVHKAEPQVANLKFHLSSLPFRCYYLMDNIKEWDFL